MTKAVLNGDRIECGKCGALLAKFMFNHNKREPQRIDLLLEDETEHDLAKTALEIKCKHKDKGKCCNTINTIEL